MPLLSKGQTWVTLLTMVILIMLAFWLRLDRLEQLPPGLSNDEAVNAVDAFHFFQSGNFIYPSLVNFHSIGMQLGRVEITDIRERNDGPWISSEMYGRTDPWRHLQHELAKEARRDPDRSSVEIRHTWLERPRLGRIRSPDDEHSLSDKVHSIDRHYPARVGPTVVDAIDLAPVRAANNRVVTRADDLAGYCSQERQYRLAI